MIEAHPERRLIGYARVSAHGRRRSRRKVPMTDDQLAAQLYELKRRNQAPIALIEMLDALLYLNLCLSAKQKRKKFYEIMARALQRLQRKDA